jgi:Ca2+-binding RTX toxin-like protein
VGGTNTVTLGNGNDTIEVGNGSNVVVEGNGADSVHAGNGNNLIVGGLGKHTLQAGNGSDILIDGSVQLTLAGESLAQVLSDWTTGASASSIRARLQVSHDTQYANTLLVGSGFDWFWYTDARDHTDGKATGLLN